MIACHSSKGSPSEGYWRWRVIDGRTCWYVGEARVGKAALTWSEARTREVVVARKFYTEADLKVPATPPPPEPHQLLDQEMTPQQRIDNAFEALGLARMQKQSWIEPYAGPYTVNHPLAPSATSEVVAVAATSEDGAATVPLRDPMEIALMLGIVVLALLLWRGVRATFGTIGRAQ
jgi:hypothetical protein